MVTSGAPHASAFERGQSEALFERRVGDHGGPAEQRGNDVVVEVAGPDHVGRDPARGDRVAHGSRAPPVAAGEHEAQVAMRMRQRREGGDEGRDVLAGFDRARRTRRTAARCRAPRATRDPSRHRHPGGSVVCRHRAARRRRRPRGGATAARRVGGVLADAHDRGRASRARPDHAPEVQDLAPLVPLGMIEEREVVDRDHGRDAIAQRHRVVRAVPHVGCDPIARAAAPRPVPTRGAPDAATGAAACSAASGASAAQRSASPRRVRRWSSTPALVDNPRASAHV